VNLLYENEITGSSPVVIRALVNDMMNCIKNWNKLDEDEEYEFRLVLNELISNGVFHGNKGYCNKRVKVGIEEVDEITLDIWVKDEGNGFDYNKICSSFDCDHILLSEGGRGLMLVTAICNNIQFNHRGSLIKIRKSIHKRVL
jgi:serine/threonine-protein kinase RsbW